MRDVLTCYPAAIERKGCGMPAWVGRLVGRRRGINVSANEGGTQVVVRGGADFSLVSASINRAADLAAGRLSDGLGVKGVMAGSEGLCSAAGG